MRDQSDNLLLDAAVAEALAGRSLLEIGGWHAAERHHGLALLRWRSHYLEATRAGVEAVGLPDDLAALGGVAGRFDRVIVHLSKSRPATAWDVALAHRWLHPDGRLLFCGGNELGVRSALRRLGESWGPGEVLANRARQRVTRFARPAELADPSRPNPLRLDVSGRSVTLRTAPGVFSAKKIDDGTALLLAHLPALPGLLASPPRVVWDAACGAGPLAAAAGLVFPYARLDLCDADAVAVECAEHNLRAADLHGRSCVRWWDAHETWPDSADLVLCNPPFHDGKRVSLQPALHMFEQFSNALSPGGEAWIVANRTLPYEAPLAAWGHVTCVAEDRGYKVLRVVKKS